MGAFWPIEPHENELTFYPRPMREIAISEMENPAGDFPLKRVKKSPKKYNAGQIQEKTAHSPLESEKLKLQFPPRDNLGPSSKSTGRGLQISGSEESLEAAKFGHFAQK